MAMVQMTVGRHILHMYRVSSSVRKGIWWVGSVSGSQAVPSGTVLQLSY